MKEIHELKMTYLDKYDVNVKPFLTYAEIQTIVNAIPADVTWSVRQVIIDKFILGFCTDIEDDELNKMNPDELFGCGLVGAVKNAVWNMDDLYAAIDYEGSATRLIGKLMTELPKYTKQLEEKIKDGKVGKE